MHQGRQAGAHDDQQHLNVEITTLNSAFRLLANRTATAGFEIHRPVNGPLTAATVTFHSTAGVDNRDAVDRINEAAAHALNDEWQIARNGDWGPVRIMQMVVQALRPPLPFTLADLATLSRPIRVPTELPVTGLAGIRRPSGRALVCLFPGCDVQHHPQEETTMYRHVLSAHYTPARNDDERLIYCFPHPKMYVLVYPRFTNQYPDVWDTSFAK